MPEYLSPGVYVEEIKIGAKPIEGVSTSTAGFLGETERGPTLPSRLPITSWLEFQRVYGGYFGVDKYLPYAVEGFFRNGGQRCYIARITKKTAEAAEFTLKAGAVNAIKVVAIGEGSWGKRIAVKANKSSDGKTFKLSLFYWKELPSALYDPELNKAEDRDKPRPDFAEVFDNISIDESSPNFYGKTVNSKSNLIQVKPLNGAAKVPDCPIAYLAGETGVESPVGLEDYTRTDMTTPGEKKGLTSFEDIDNISIVYIPDTQNIQDLYDAVVNHCEHLKDRFAIIDAKKGDPAPKKPGDTKYAAVYYPWINIIDPRTGSKILVPPGGHVAGIYARSDVERGVHKAPANEVIRGVDSLEFPVNKGKQDVLNPQGINCIRVLGGRGIRVWGARTLSTDPLWKYVNIRRLFLYLEESIEEGTQWVVFEPNNEKLWDKVKQTISQFLTRVWKDGELIGTTPEEAFFVKCDRTTMTQDDIDNGRLIVLIGVAPVKPAEFVIFRIAQWAGGSSATE